MLLVAINKLVAGYLITVILNEFVCFLAHTRLGRAMHNLSTGLRPGIALGLMLACFIHSTISLVCVFGVSVLLKHPIESKSIQGMVRGHVNNFEDHRYFLMLPPSCLIVSTVLLSTSD